MRERRQLNRMSEKTPRPSVKENRGGFCGKQHSQAVYDPVKLSGDFPQGLAVAFRNASETERRRIAKYDIKLYPQSGGEAQKNIQSGIDLSFFNAAVVGYGNIAVPRTLFLRPLPFRCSLTRCMWQL